MHWIKIRIIIISFPFILITVVDDEVYNICMCSVFVQLKKKTTTTTIHEQTTCMCQMEYYAKVIKIKASIVCFQHLFDLFLVAGV